MAALEILVVFGILSLAGVGVNGLRLAWRGRARRKDLMRDDLRKALAAGDHRKLDDFLVLWSGELDESTLAHVKERRDELYIETNDGAR
jgi:hypothetical protein